MDEHNMAFASRPSTTLINHPGTSLFLRARDVKRLQGFVEESVFSLLCNSGNRLVCIIEPSVAVGGCQFSSEINIRPSDNGCDFGIN